MKTHGRQELVIAGYTKGQGRRSNAFGALVLGVNEGGVLRWAGNVGTGFDEAEIARLLAQAEAAAPRRDAVRGGAEDAEGAQGDVVWVEPKLVAEIRFAEWTHDGRLRAPVYQGLREDKEASEVHREQAPLPAGDSPGQARR